MRCGDRSFFVGTDDILESIAESCADDSFVEPIEDPDARGSTFEGDKVKDPQSPNHGKRMKDGWRISNLPWTYDLDVNLVYLPKGKPKAK